jgi:hypothetical protein
VLYTGAHERRVDELCRALDSLNGAPLPKPALRSLPPLTQMGRLCVTSTMKRQLADLRDRRGNVRKGGVMHAPRILGLKDWEALANVQQDALIDASYEDRRAQQMVPVSLDPTAVVSHRYE